MGEILWWGCEITLYNICGRFYVMIFFPNGTGLFFVKEGLFFREMTKFPAALACFLSNQSSCPLFAKNLPFQPSVFCK